MACTSFCVSLIFFMIVVSCQCMPSEEILSRQKRVVGGQQYKNGEHPYHVSLWYMGDNNPYTANTPNLHHTCGGTLIDESWVLTSATCFDDAFLPGLGNFSLWEVYLGMHEQTKAENEAQFRRVHNVFSVPQYNLSVLYGDMALLKLDRPADLNDVVSTIGINNDDDCPELNEDVVVIGFGQTQNHTYGQGSNVPYEGTVKVADLAHCHDKYTTPEIEKLTGPVQIDERILCAGLPQGGVDACYGDLGSPLLGRCGPDDKSVVVATVSYGYGCGQADFPAVYSRVSSYYDWIMTTIENN